MDFLRTPRFPDASEVRVSIFLDEVYVQCFQRGYIVVIARVIVPGCRVSEAMRMEKGHCRGQIVVIVKDVVEVCVRFTAFIHIGVEGLTRVVHGIYGMLPPTEIE